MAVAVFLSSGYAKYVETVAQCQYQFRLRKLLQILTVAYVLDLAFSFTLVFHTNGAATRWRVGCHLVFVRMIYMEL